MPKHRQLYQRKFISNENQWGFIKGRSTEGLLTHLTEKWKIALQSCMKVLRTVLQYSYFSVISQFPLKTVHPFRNSLAVLPPPPPPPPYTKLKLGKNFGYTRPTLFVGWGEGLDLGALENVPETQKCPKTFDQAILTVFQACKSVFSGFWWKSFPWSECHAITKQLHTHKQCFFQRILGDVGAASRDDRMFEVKVYYKFEKKPWALTLTEPVPEAFELPASDFFLAS